MSVFLRDDEDRIFHTYSTYGRGLDVRLATCRAYGEGRFCLIPAQAT